MVAKLKWFNSLASDDVNYIAHRATDTISSTLQGFEAVAPPSIKSRISKYVPLRKTIGTDEQLNASSPTASAYHVKVTNEGRECNGKQLQSSLMIEIYSKVEFAKRSTKAPKDKTVSKMIESYQVYVSIPEIQHENGEIIRKNNHKAINKIVQTEDKDEKDDIITSRLNHISNHQEMRNDRDNNRNNYNNNNTRIKQYVLYIKSLQNISQKQTTRNKYRYRILTNHPLKSHETISKIDFISSINHTLDYKQYNHHYQEIPTTNQITRPHTLKYNAICYALIYFLGKQQQIIINNHHHKINIYRLQQVPPVTRMNIDTSTTIITIGITFNIHYLPKTNSENRYSEQSIIERLKENGK